MPRSILVTGGAGFIGSNFVRYLIGQIQFDGTIVVLDKLTYAGNRSNLPSHDLIDRSAVAAKPAAKLRFCAGDIADTELVTDLMRSHQIDTIVNFAAESHVDRSIDGSSPFVQTNIVGVHQLLTAALRTWDDRDDVRFHQVSTDEVFGTLGDTGVFTEASSYAPRSPYAATKASADHLVHAFHETYGLPTSVSYCSNNYGPYQHPEKLIPLMISRMASGESLPVYGDGTNVRDWLHVSDHCEAVWLTLSRARPGTRYAFGGNCELSNLDLVRLLAEAYAERATDSTEEILERIEFVADRPGHDFRYAVDSSLARADLSWSATVSIREGLAQTVGWYLDHGEWVRETIRSSGEWFEGHYQSSQGG